MAKFNLTVSAVVLASLLAAASVTLAAPPASNADQSGMMKSDQMMQAHTMGNGGMMPMMKMMTEMNAMMHQMNVMMANCNKMMENMNAHMAAQHQLNKKQKGQHD